MEKHIFDQEKYKHPFDERLIEVVRGKKYNCYEYLKSHHQIYQMDEPLCVQYNPKQRPTSSFGIAFYNIAQKKWFVVEPRFTIEFITLIKGMYTTHYLPFLMDQLYDSELELIITDPDPEDVTSTPEKRVYKHIHKLMFNTDIIQILYETMWSDNYNIILSIASSILKRRRENSETCLQCVFPKGRAGGGETWAETAVREVFEETGIRVMFDNPGHVMERLNSKHTNTDQDTNIWEPCQVKFSQNVVDGYISRLHVTHTHSTMGGKMYRTVMWICVVSLGVDEIDNFKVVENSETRIGMWLDEEGMRRKFRVQDLYTKCENMLNKYYPYLTY